ncbi:MAG: hypothetical protein ACI8Y7_000124 [Candidatus Woesearchaeota archaeon]|jgi:hypothetical protein
MILSIRAKNGIIFSLMTLFLFGILFNFSLSLVEKNQADTKLVFEYAESSKINHLIGELASTYSDIMDITAFRFLIDASTIQAYFIGDVSMDDLSARFTEFAAMYQELESESHINVTMVNLNQNMHIVPYQQDILFETDHVILDITDSNAHHLNLIFLNITFAHEVTGETNTFSDDGADGVHIRVNVTDNTSTIYQLSTRLAINEANEKFELATLSAGVLRVLFGDLNQSIGTFVLHVNDSDNITIEEIRFAYDINHSFQYTQLMTNGTIHVQTPTFEINTSLVLAKGETQ